ncbi:MAG: ribosome biogenesis GTPase Der [Chloroflexi bacterium]|nr:ribosome biogenesis GTPase Der [Chloroflexota bacterium]
MDTGGLEPTPGSNITRLVREQAELAIDQADVILFLVDTKEGITPADQDIADILRRTEKPVIVVANKADNKERRLNSIQFYELGVGEIIPISATHGTGTGDLLDSIIAWFPSEAATEAEADVVGVAIVGRPNVGKSSLLNALLGEERVIVHEVPGTTRDAIDTFLEYGDRRVVLIDTAGIRRRGRVEAGIEKYSVLRALRAINRADIAALVIDAVEGIAAQDTHIAGYIQQAAKGIILIVNKWDLVKKTSHTEKEFTRAIREELKFLPYAPILFTSAKTKQGVPKILPAALQIKGERQKRIPTGLINSVIGEAVLAHSPPSVRGHRLKILYVSQIGVEPPTFAFVVNDPKLLHFSYQRYLENKLREDLGFEGTPLRLFFRARREGSRQA